MSQAVHLMSNNFPGCGSLEGRCLPCLGVSGRMVAVSSCSSRGDLRIFSQVKVGVLKCAAKGTSFVSKAGSGAYRRNPDIRQNRNGFRGRNRQNEERDNFDDESELLSSKNGPLLSLSSSPKFQATSAPGPREKEIVELFRKVQSQLRERAAAKEDKKIEVTQGQRKESETVDSLLKLLRKHSLEQGKRKSSSGNTKDFVLDKTEQNAVYVENKSTSFFDSSSGVGAEAREPKEPNASSLTRPASNFRRRSPVTQFKYQPIYPSEETMSSVSQLDSSGKRKNSAVEISTDSRHQTEPELELESESEHDASFVDGDVYVELSDSEPNILIGNVYDEVSDNESDVVEDSVYEALEGESLDIDNADNNEHGEKEEDIEHPELSALKLPELRAIAKSRGVKGFSKMKKGKLVELLSGSLI
ncbi:rho-N domain-containing protein 1, chloroplastic-like [Mangifera indica]|uniref:rho-N domain-containing protein 1, chloroplastic-like n=1 Tax=Mangifera indica TaxID=29780 RepID=UPI001CFB2AF0|nr:rho-N domain-containing protein 1, chloroplastic-like [Mangifera indica]